MSKLSLDDVVIYSQDWPIGRDLKVRPGDLSQFGPYGNGLYGYQRKNVLDPIQGDPPQEESAGIIYFGNGVRREDFEALLRVLNIQADRKDYAAFVQESSNPEKDRFFKQMRVVSKFGLRFGFNAIDNNEHDKFPEQKLATGDALLAFMEAERNRFGTEFGDSRIDGKMGGDGNYAREELRFGFMLENEYHGIYRIWSGAWLVTK